MTSQPDYNNSNFNGHVDIGGYELHVQIAGRPRKDDEPLVICIHGTAGHLEQFAAVVRTLQPSHRLLAYTRSGLGHSDPKPKTPNTSPAPPTLDSIADELHSLLTALSLPPPYILLAHSWGGMLSLHITSTLSPRPLPGVQGLILLDAGMPTLSPTFQPLHSSFASDPGTPWAHSSVAALLTNLDVHALQDPAHLLQLTASEHAALLAARSPATHKAGAPLEFQGLFASYAPFSINSYHAPNALPRPLPICLIHAHTHASFRKMFDAGVARGNGTPEERKEFEHLLSTWKEDVLANQRQFLRYARHGKGGEGAEEDGEELGRSIIAREGTSHSVMLQDVESVREGVEWVVGLGGA